MKKVAIITGSSGGIGRACAIALKAEYELALLSRSEKVMMLAEELGALGVQGSVTEKSDLKKLVNLTMGKFGRIDSVVNNTGHPAGGSLLEISEEEWHHGLNLVLLNVAKMAALVTPIMKKQGSGVYVNISTFAATEPSAAFPVSSVLRAGLANYAKLYADEFAVNNIRMNNVLPGYINSFKATAEIVNKIPMKRQGLMEEVAKTVKFLLSDDAAYITGQNIKVDGGLTRSVI
ncbi:SDR family oxidoreductase [Fulvivirga sediminis]|uniref:SDR family oxidoreductase n=1 Tax=Fulvivirga sediminis TaxID=2803949 RepID=A0A937F525_9BACT|nr:SDR family oxidoreductase [Fulvivirga sediminis]MBL3656552.1 SDR family oxidoreductase [Fulvivirga sediminis]